MLAILVILLAQPDLGTLFSWVISGIGVVGFLAAAAQFLRGSADKGTIISLQNSVNALETAGEIKDDKITALVEQVHTLTTELEVWRNAVTAKEELTNLQKNVLEHHVESMKSVHEIKDCLNDLSADHKTLIGMVEKGFAK